MKPTPTDRHLRLHCIWATFGWFLVGIVIYLSITSQPPRIELDLPYADKLGHMLAYFTITFWFVQLERATSRRILYGVIFVVLGALLEWIQGFSPIRHFDLHDMVANTVGVLLGILLGYTPLQYIITFIDTRLTR